VPTRCPWLSSFQFAFITQHHPELDTPPFMLALSLLLADARATAGDGVPVHESLLTDRAGPDGGSSPIDLLRTLPSEAELRHLPVVAEPRQLAMLQGTDAHSLATGLRLEMEETYRQLIQLLVDAPSPPLHASAITLSRWRWRRHRASSQGF
jgi:hypothetical protein